jgi:outer membrane protein TolC
MKKIAIFLFSAILWSAPAMSLTIAEALNSAIENSNRIKQFSSLADSQGEKVKAEKSEFFPSLYLGYTFVRQEKDIFFSTKNRSDFAVEGTYNLFNGFVDTKNLEKEEHLLVAERYQEEAVVEDVLLETKRAFIDVLRIGSNLEAAKEGVELLKRQRRDSELRFKEGLIAKNDLLNGNGWRGS